MPFRPATLAEIYRAPFDDLIDVRSPAEFAEDHVPGAISLPVLSNEERARVGTIYTQEAPFKARKIGAALVARNAAAHLEGPLQDRDGAWKPLVYCWRGGQRSGAFASILAQVGWRADTVEGGYRSYRRLVVKLLHDDPLAHRVVLLDGDTGTAKTEVLGLVAARGGQVLDLEGLAAHRGSVFGAVDRPQPAQKGFESALARAFHDLDPARPVLVEAESSKIGDLLVPPSLWAAMRAAPRIRLTAPVPARARYLARAYADIAGDPAVLEAVLDRLVPYHGRALVAEWKALAAAGEIVRLAGDLVARHYDIRYARARVARDGAALAEVALPALEPDDLTRAADRIAGLLAGQAAGAVAT